MLYFYPLSFLLSDKYDIFDNTLLQFGQLWTSRANETGVGKLVQTKVPLPSNPEGGSGPTMLKSSMKPPMRRQDEKEGEEVVLREGRKVGDYPAWRLPSEA